ncbi:hypothetical protein TrCOL_g5251 [Triparma columacea]|uniref:Cyclic nucleotide-binding domain-containing protein n=1 Tax=Triparma columacea TaxID=722753 RepID=A0A9W7G5Q0_9STRA|nr:hypothetical protein TrCOL_g5251 [Triparma columacea]
MRESGRGAGFNATPSEVPSRTEYKESLPPLDDNPNNKIVTFKSELDRQVKKKLKWFRKGGVSSSVKKIQILHQDELTESFEGGVSEEQKPKSNYESFNAFIIHPNDPMRRAFDLITVFLVIYLIFKIPFDVGFDWYENSFTEEAWLICLDVWFTLDIILNFKTGYISNGTAVMHPKKVRYHYLAGWFIIDLIGTIPFKYFVTDGEKGKSIKLSKFFKIPKLLRISRVLKYMRNNKQVYDIFKVFVFIIISLHLGSCLWVLVIDPCKDGYLLVDSPWCDQDLVYDVYAESLHISTVMILGISNSHIMGNNVIIGNNETLDSNLPQDNLNKSQLHIISILFMVYGLYLGALMVSEMTVYVMGRTQGSSAFQRKIDRVNHEMEYYAVPFELRGKVKAFYDYIWVNQKQYDEQIGLLSDKSMSTDLQRQLALHLFKDVVSHISFFADVDDIVLGQICLSLKTLVFLPQDMILFKGDVGKELFIIAKGVVEVMRDDLPKDKRAMANRILLRSGSFFGEIALVMEVRRTCSVQARTVCEINILLQSTFDDVLREHPDFAKRMNELVVARQMETSMARLGVDPNNTKFRQADLDFANEAVKSQMQAGLHRRENPGHSLSKDHGSSLSMSSTSLLNKKIFPVAAEAEEQQMASTDSGGSLQQQPSSLLTMKTDSNNMSGSNLFDELERRKSVGEIDVTPDGKKLRYLDTKETGENEEGLDARRHTKNTLHGHFNAANTYDMGKVHPSILLGGEKDKDNSQSGTNRVATVMMKKTTSFAGDEEIKTMNDRMVRTEEMIKRLLTKLDPEATIGSPKSPKSSLPPIEGIKRKKRQPRPSSELDQQADS